MGQQTDSTTTTFYDKDVDVVLKELETSPKGLTSEEAERRLVLYGRNELEEKGKVSRWRLFLAQFEDFLVIVLVFAALISAFVGEYVDSIVIWAILIANAFLGYIQESRAEAAIEALKELGAAKATVLRDGLRKDVYSFNIVPGDVVLLETGYKVPADGRIIEETNFRVDEAALTGESTPVSKKAKTLERKGDDPIPVNDQKNMVFSSTIVTYGRATVVVTHTGMNTQIGRIAEMLQTQEEGETPLQRKLGKFGKQLGILILAICGVVFLGNWMRGEDVLTSFLVAISLAVAAIPEGLPAVVTTTLGIGVQRMSKRNAIIRKLPATETLGCATTICSDKTGTLTRNEMTIRRLYVNHQLLEVTGSGYVPTGDVLEPDTGRKVGSDPTLERHVLAGYLCNNAALALDEKGHHVIQGDPTEGAFVVLGEKMGLKPDEVRERYQRVMEVFFDSKRKRMSVVVQDALSDGELHAYMKGAPEIVLDLCDRIEVNGVVRPITGEDRKKILAANQKMGENALRVLATAYRPVDLTKPLTEDSVESELIFLGLSGMIDPPRKEVKDAVNLCKKAGIKVVMITGDHALTAKAIAKELGIVESDDEPTIVGSDIDALPDSALVDCRVFARVAPEHKYRIVQALQDHGEIVAMTGDGVNDAPALKKADTGIAMGITGTDVAKEASHMILADDNFASIVASVEEGRGIYDNMKKFILFLISCNIAEILVIFIGIMVGLPLPLIAVQILWINLTTDGLPALALGVDPYDPDVMERPPRNPRENIINQRLVVSILVRGIIITIITLGLYYAVLETTVPNWPTLAEDDPALHHPRTYIFATMLICEMLNVYNCRSEKHSVFKISFFSNIWLTLAVLSSVFLTLLVIYVPSMAEVFKLAPLPWYEWFVIVPLSFLTIVSEEIIKWYWRKYKYPKMESYSHKSNS
ncbi:MAG: calcium-transporting P-type ATPase, PMR1-type [Promethearchaeota archaeon]